MMAKKISLANDLIQANSVSNDEIILMFENCQFTDSKIHALVKLVVQAVIQNNTRATKASNLLDELLADSCANKEIGQTDSTSTFIDAQLAFAKSNHGNKAKRKKQHFKNKYSR